ncbi:SUMO-activating enzyme subunit 2-like [Styela clava]
MESNNQLTDQALTKDVQSIVNDAKIFVIGAGGIGCELIKNLVLIGFKHLEIIDLDTIDISNLNRQFLFQKKHVGKSKARVAHENATALRPNINVLSHHASIFNPSFNMEYFKKFDIVLNALDNRAARNHVNRLCLAAGVPLVESGSAGYLGQVNVIKRGKTECYECSPKPRQKTFPSCTIRNTPSELIHCVVWAKYLFNQLFGEDDADQDVSPDTTDLEEDAADSSEKVSTKIWAKDCDYDPEKIFNKLFQSDIEYLLSMDKLWEKRKPPTPIKWIQQANNSKHSTSSQMIMSLEENMQLFGNSLTLLKDSLHQEGSSDMLVWDKDDDTAMRFVSSAANIRAAIFGIPQKSIFEIKSMAGNIIPAIATTNAVVAGLIVMQALCILQNEFERCRNVFVSRVANPGKKLIAPCVLDPPNPACYVCVEKPEITLRLDTKVMTLGVFKDKILKLYLGMSAPDVDIDGTGVILLSSEEGESDDSLPKSLSEFGIQNGSRLCADDFLQNFKLIINILHSTELSEDVEFEVINKTGIIFQQDGVQLPTAKEKEESEFNDLDDVCIVESDGESHLSSVISNNNKTDSHILESRKRKLDLGSGEEIEQDAKRVKCVEASKLEDCVEMIE